MDVGIERLIELRVADVMTKGVITVSASQDLAAVSAIFVENGFPRDETYGILVHELTHLWQLDNFPLRGVADMYSEGSAAWVQYQALDELGAKRPMERIANSSDVVYGDGFRWVASMEKRVGKTRTLDSIVVYLVNRT